MPTDTHLFSSGCAWKVGQDPYWDEQSAWRSPCDDQTSNRSEGWPQHSAQAHASDRFGVGRWVHDGEQYLVIDYSARAFGAGGVTGILGIPPQNFAFT